MFELADSASNEARIKVIGVGGGGGNAVQHMLNKNVAGVEFVAANTDAQALSKLEVRQALQLGPSVTKGLGAGANPEIGRQAAYEDRDKISEILRNTEMVFITAGMGGGTGTGAAPVIAEVAQQENVLTVAVVTRPFWFENRTGVANEGIEELARHVDSLIVIPNEKLLPELGGSTTMLEAFAQANNVLLHAVQGVADLIITHGLINVDFADVRNVMTGMGMAVMGMGTASGDARAEDAAHAAINSPLLDDVDLDGARGVLVNVTGSESITLEEVMEVGKTVNGFASPDAKVVIGMVIDPDMADELKVTVVATGLGDGGQKAALNPATVGESDRELNYSEFDPPSYARSRKPAAAAPRRNEPAAPPVENVEFLDIRRFAQG